MGDFRKLGETMMASPQISVEDVAAAAAEGVTLIVNNRPDGESLDQPEGAEIAAAAADAGVGYCAIPITHAGFSLPQVEAMREAMDSADGKVLAYCRSGTRSTLLWALAEAKAGKDPEDIARAAMQAGYDIGPIRPTVDMLAGKTG